MNGIGRFKVMFIIQAGAISTGPVRVLVDQESDGGEKDAISRLDGFYIATALGFTFVFLLSIILVHWAIFDKRIFLFAWYPLSIVISAFLLIFAYGLSRRRSMTGLWISGQKLASWRGIRNGVVYSILLGLMIFLVLALSEIAVVAINPSITAIQSIIVVTVVFAFTMIGRYREERLRKLLGARNRLYRGRSVASVAKTIMDAIESLGINCSIEEAGTDKAKKVTYTLMAHPVKLITVVENGYDGMVLVSLDGVREGKLELFDEWRKVERAIARFSESIHPPGA